MLKKVILISIFLLLISCRQSSRNKNDNKVHLRSKNTIEFYINKQANILSETVIRETFQKWGDATHFTFVYKGRNRAGLHKDGKNTVSFLLRWPKEIPINKIGYCKNWYDSDGTIIESDIILNMQISNFTTMRTNKPNAYYVEGVVAHEIGHMLGLGHINKPASIMKKKSSPKESYHKGRIDAYTLKAYGKLYKIDVKNEN